MQYRHTSKRPRMRASSSIPAIFSNKSNNNQETGMRIFAVAMAEENAFFIKETSQIQHSGGGVGFPFCLVRYRQKQGWNFAQCQKNNEKYTTML